MGFRQPKGGAQIKVINEDIATYAAKHKSEFDFVYAGIVLLNIGKVVDEDMLAGIINEIAGTVSEDGILGVSTTPAALYGEKRIPDLIQRSGMHITDLFLDNLTNTGRGLRGGYCIRATKSYTESPISTGEVNKVFALDKDLSKVSTKGYFAPNGDLDTNLQDLSDSLPIVALSREGGYYMKEGTKETLMKILPKERITFSMLSILEYR